MKFLEQFSNTVLCLWELHIALNYTCLWWVRSVVFFCVSFTKYFSICSSDIYYTICLMIFSNLTFLDTRQSGVQLVLGIQRVLGVQTRRSFVTIREWSEKIHKKPRSFSNEVSSNNAKSHFPGQLAESFRLGNISIYLKPWSSTNVKNWIFFHDRRFLYRIYGCVYSLKAWKMVSDVLEE